MTSQEYDALPDNVKPLANMLVRMAADIAYVRKAIQAFDEEDDGVRTLDNG